MSEGPGPVGDVLTCESMTNQSTFVIRRTAAITIKQGLHLNQGDEPVSMVCKKGQGGWACNQVSATRIRNPLSARAYRNSQGVITAQIFEKSDSGEMVMMDSLLCQNAE